MKFCAESQGYESFFDHDSASSIWNCALFIARQGFKVFPLLEQGKTPLLKGWQDKATDNENTILEWAKVYPNHNYGILTGNGFFVIDFDLDESDDIDEEIQRVQEKLGLFEPGTMVKTGRGYQLYCGSVGFNIRNNHEKRLTDTVDIKGAGGYVVGPGSIHPNGKRYEFCDVHTFRDGIKLTKLSEAALNYIVSLQGSLGIHGTQNDTGPDNIDRAESVPPRNALDYAKPIPEGKRNDTLFRVGCHHREVNRRQTNDVYRILKDINNSDCETPLRDSELEKIAESCCNYPPGEPRTQMIQSPPHEPCSEDVLEQFQGNKLIELFRRNVQKFHVGDWNVAELELLSVASQSVVNTDGIQPKLSGESGKGRVRDMRMARRIEGERRLHAVINRSNTPRRRRCASGSYGRCRNRNKPHEDDSEKENCCDAGK